MNSDQSRHQPKPARGTYAWFEGLSASEKRDYMERYGSPPADPRSRSFTPGSLSPYSRRIGGR